MAGQGVGQVAAGTRRQTYYLTNCMYSCDYTCMTGMSMELQ